MSEFAILGQLKSNFPKQIYLSVGLHPWESARQSLVPYRPYFTQADMLGEVGLDSVWCKVPMAQQSLIFKKQVKIAQQLGKPLVLHTKGAEAIIADFLATQAVTIPILVHWYSGDLASLLMLKQLDCYFSIAPDISYNEAHAQVLQHITPTRIMTETDGLRAIAWAKQHTQLNDYLTIPDSLIEQINIIAQAWNCEPAQVKQQIQHNFKAFIEWQG